MAETYRLDASGPHSADYTGHVAQALTEAVRVLNHATRTRQGLPDPQTVHNVLGELAAAIAGLDQLLPQLAEQLARRNADSCLADTSGNPDLAVEDALMHLDVATHAARALGQQVAHAHTATSGLSLRDGGEA